MSRLTELYIFLGYLTIFLITGLIILYNILSRRRLLSNLCQKCRNQDRGCNLPENGRLISLSDLKSHVCENLAQKRFQQENRLVNKRNPALVVCSIEEEPNALNNKPAAADEPDSTSKPRYSHLPQVFTTDIAEYLHHSRDEALDVQLLAEFSPHICITFNKPLDHFGLRVQKYQVPTYNTSDGAYTVSEEHINSTCLLVSYIVTVTAQNTGHVQDICSFAVPQWGDNYLPDFYSILLLHKIISNLREENDMPKVKIFIHSSKSRYVSVVTVLENLHQMTTDNSLNPISIINKFKLIYPDLHVTEEDHIWIYRTLMHCHDSPIQLDTVESFAAAHKPLYLHTYSFCLNTLQRLRTFVPPINMVLCTTGAQLENRSRNRSANILPLDSERPQFDQFTPPLENKYINATYIKGHLSAHDYIVTEWPQTKTIPAFWRLVRNENIDRIFVIGEAGRLSKFSNFPQFWPSGKTKDSIKLKHNTLTVTQVSCEEKDYNNISKFSILIDEQRFVPVRETIAHQCQLYNIQYWPRYALGEDCSNLLEALIQLIYSARESTAGDSSTRKLNICVVSRSGAGKCGVILTLWAVLDQLEQLGHSFDLFNTMRLIKINRPQMLDSIEDIAMIHELLHQMRKMGKLSSADT